MSGVATYLVRAVVDASIREMDGKTLTQPALLVGDQSGELTYCVDIDIGQKTIDPNDGEEVPAILKNVAIASGDLSILYAGIGAAVRVRRSDSGRWEVAGFSKTLPGTYTRIQVDMGEPGADVVDYIVRPPVDVSLHSRLLTYDELADHGGYGVVPYGAVGVFRGETLLEIR